MNSRHRNIQFTCEEESNDTLLYRKKTFSGVYMNYSSFLSTNYKKGLIDTLLFRSYNMY